MSASSMMDFYSLTVETPSLSLGVTLNTLLLHLIRTYSTALLGNYKYLLAIFASYDVYLCCLHGVLNPVVIVVGNTFGCALYAPWQSRMLTGIFYACFTLPFALMNIHFLYRYWSIAHPTRLALFSEPRFVAKISLYPLTQAIIWYNCCQWVATNSDDPTLAEVQEVFAETHIATIDDGWLVMDHWRDGAGLNMRLFIIIIITMIVIFGNLSVAAVLATLTYKEIAKTTKLSSKLITMQYTLLVAVCAQTFVPVLCVYIPYFLIIMCPFLSLPGFGMVNNFPFLVSVFPGWDAIVIIALIRDYRIGLVKAVGLYRDKVILLRNTQFTTSVHPSRNPISQALPTSEVSMIRASDVSIVPLTPTVESPRIVYDI